MILDIAHKIKSKGLDVKEVAPNVPLLLEVQKETGISKRRYSVRTELTNGKVFKSFSQDKDNAIKQQIKDIEAYLAKKPNLPTSFSGEGINV